MAGDIAKEILPALLRQQGAYVNPLQVPKGGALLFDVMAKTSTETLLILIRRRRDPLASIETVEKAFRKEIGMMQKYPQTPGVRLVIYLFRTPPPGKPAGTWRAFEVHPDGVREIPPPYIPSERSGYQGAV